MKHGVQRLQQVWEYLEGRVECDTVRAYVSVNQNFVHLNQHAPLLGVYRSSCRGTGNGDFTTCIEDK